jgi:stage II sporulation protein D
MKSLLKKLLKLNFFILLFLSCAHISCANEYNQQKIRIAVADDVESFVISTRGSYKILNTKNEVLAQGRKLRNSRVLFHDGRIYIGKSTYNVTHLRVSTMKDVGVVVDNKLGRYRDSIDIIIDKKNKLLLVNIVDLESYIRGVLYHEVSHRWPMEATKAQAVAARSYALYKINERRNHLYDVTNDIYSQMYGGKSAERYRTNLAVKSTHGQVLTYRGEVLPTYYHSNSGGHTEDVSELWNHDLVPLKGVADPYAKDTPNYNWKKNFQSKIVQDSLNKGGYDLGLIEDIKIVERTKSNRVKKISVIARDGKKVLISGKKFRQILGPNIIKSSLFEVVMMGYYFDVVGHGWGHGVGMCQWGANKMAKKRFSYSEILEFYYPESEIVTLK